jgi:hypothetical protein
VTSGDEPGPEWARAADLVTFGQLRELLGVGRTRAQTIVGEHRFPRPWFISEDGKTRLWRRQDIEPWLDVNRPGWRG